MTALWSTLQGKRGNYKEMEKWLPFEIYKSNAESEVSIIEPQSSTGGSSTDDNDDDDASR